MLNTDFLKKYIGFYENNLSDIDSEEIFTLELGKIISLLEENNFTVSFQNTTKTNRSLPESNFWIVTTCNLVDLSDTKTYSEFTFGFAAHNKFQALLFAIDKYLYLNN